MRIGRVIARKQATKIIEYHLIEYTGINTVYSIAKIDIQHDFTKWIAKCITSKQAIDLIWDDVINGLQK